MALTRTVAMYTAESPGNHGLGMFWLLATNKSAGATDRLDKIYGLQSLARSADDDDGDGLFAKPDYSLDTATVYQQVTEKFFARFARLDLFPGGYASTGRRTAGLPSWAVDWDDDQPARASLGRSIDETYESWTDPPYDPCLTEQFPKVFEVHGKILKLNGLILDEITASAPLGNLQDFLTQKGPSQDEKDMLALALLGRAMRVWKYSSRKKYRHTETDFLDVLIHSLLALNPPRAHVIDSTRRLLPSILSVASKVEKLWKSPLGRSRLGLKGGLAVIKLIHETLPSPTVEAKREAFIGVLQELVPLNYSHCGIRTAKDYVGVSLTAEALPGDRVALVRGALHPWILRPNPDGLWTLVGYAYVHGVMHGEAFDASKCGDICIK